MDRSLLRVLKEIESCLFGIKCVSKYDLTVVFFLDNAKHLKFTYVRCNLICS